MAKHLLLFAIVILETVAFPNSYIGERIVGGSEAKEGTYTYQVSLRTLADFHFCGGSIVDATTILTAAHCVDYEERPDNLVVVVGSHKLDRGGDTYAVKTVKVNRAGDIAILILKEPVQLSDKASAVKLEAGRVASGVECVVSGWGDLSASGPAPNDLQYVALKTLNYSDCRVAVGSARDKKVCTFTRAGEGTCFGDSGGPLVITESQTQIGIVSRGRPCAVGYPDIFTEVAPFIDWINENKSV